jgi:hypothetical protein
LKDRTTVDLCVLPMDTSKFKDIRNEEIDSIVQIVKAKNPKIRTLTCDGLPGDRLNLNIKSTGVSKKSKSYVALGLRASILAGSIGLVYMTHSYWWLLLNLCGLSPYNGISYSLYYEGNRYQMNDIHYISKEYWFKERAISKGLLLDEFRTDLEKALK